tara:strand:- start:717 stop:953 length:237 start_codon:yes stop_codon:yes gene_type:complete
MSDMVRVKIDELLEDDLITKNVKNKLENIKSMLNGSTTDSINIDKALHELEDVNEDPNIPSFIREEILNVTSMLSSLK